MNELTPDEQVKRWCFLCGKVMEPTWGDDAMVQPKNAVVFEGTPVYGSGLDYMGGDWGGAPLNLTIAICDEHVVTYAGRVLKHVVNTPATYRFEDWEPDENDQ